MKQIYHHYEKWECYKNGMWKSMPSNEREQLLPSVISFTGNHEAYGSAMDSVIKQWHYTCEHHLTDLSLNRKAWLGHAACNLRFGWCESIVREAWGYLTQEQQDLANAQAERVIKTWETIKLQQQNKNNHAQIEIRF